MDSLISSSWRRVFLFGLLLCGGVRAESQAGASPGTAPAIFKQQADSPATLAFEKYTLDNGLEVILHTDTRLPMVAVNIWYHTGPVNEPRGRSGFAHLFEHLMFEGSKHAGNQFDYLLESVGGTNMNGTTNWDRTNYYETVPSQELELALWLEADRMGFMIETLTQERLDVQREVVKNERRQSYENRPYGPSALALYDLIFPLGHPYHGAVIGSMQDLSSATLADVRSFFHKYYAPANATLTLAGSFEPTATKALIDKHFGTLEARVQRAPRPNPTFTPLSATRRIVREPVKLGKVAFAWLVPPAYSAEESALEIATEILASGKASRLYQTLVVPGLASDVGASLDANELASVFDVEVTGASGVPLSRVESALRLALEKFRSDGPTESELSRAKTRIKLGWASHLQRLNSGGGETGRAGTLQRLNHYLGDPGALPRILQAIENVTAADVRAAAGKFLGQAHRVAVITEPT